MKELQRIIEWVFISIQKTRQNHLNNFRQIKKIKQKKKQARPLGLALHGRSGRRFRHRRGGGRGGPAVDG
jgi:hypothetical protein